ncbi:hypothetical protein [Fundicoccus culcitae]|uniref:Uncharacterized protein n=1 Tax=Fundicoccus culcitae TaxID=2969821 RepID=A0ABY5P4X7_9LACT|nr:hypothetical protein [Fundicoccus culcitae]UUX33463.1 hypothetical protein NRE15_11215 [Fundicoccus culcitae]
MMVKKKVAPTMGWSPEAEDEINDAIVESNSMNGIQCVNCVETDFHFIDSEDTVQAIISALNEEK